MKVVHKERLVKYGRRDSGRTGLSVLQCYENGNGVLKMINKSSKNENNGLMNKPKYSNISIKKGD